MKFNDILKYDIQEARLRKKINLPKIFTTDQRLIDLLGYTKDDSGKAYKIIYQKRKGVLINYIDVTGDKTGFYLIVSRDKYDSLAYSTFGGDFIKNKIENIEFTPDVFSDVFSLSNPYNPYFFDMESLKDDLNDTLYKIERFDISDEDIVDFITKTKIYVDKPKGLSEQTEMEITDINDDIELLVFQNQERLEQIKDFQDELDIIQYNISEYIKTYNELEEGDREKDHIETLVSELKSEGEQNEKQIEVLINQNDDANVKIRQLKYLRHKIKTKNIGEAYTEEQFNEIANKVRQILRSGSPETYLMMLFGLGSDEVRKYLKSYDRLVGYIYDSEISETPEFIDKVINEKFPGVNLENIVSVEPSMIFKVKISEDLHEARLRKSIKPVDSVLVFPLAEYLDISPHTLKLLDYDYYGMEQFETEDGEQYAIGTDSQADRAFTEYQEQFIEEHGIGGFTQWFQEEIKRDYLDPEPFKDMLEEHYEFYVDDIESEDAYDGDYANRLEQEMVEAGIIDVEDEDYDGDYEDKKEEFVEYLIENAGDPVDYFKFNFGDEWLTEYINNNNILNVEGIIEATKEADGRGHSLSGYDGEEGSVVFNDEWYYIYRIN